MTSVKPVYNSSQSKALHSRFTTASITAKSLDVMEAAMLRQMVDRGFYAALLVSRKIVKLTEGTAGVDGDESIVVNETWLGERSKEDQDFILDHEALHVGLAHHARLDNRDANMANIAMDAAINQMLIDDGRRAPADAVTIDTVAKQMGWPSVKREALRRAAWEEIYQAIVDDLPPPPPPPPGGGEPEDGEEGDEEGEPGQKPKPPGQGPNKPGKVPQGQEWGNVKAPEGGLTQDEKDQRIAEANENMQRAVNQSILAGTASDTIKKIAADAVAVKIDWKAVLRDFVSKGSNITSYTYSKMPRRLSTWRLPAPVKTGMGRLIILMDKSGSITERMTEQYISEMNNIIGEVLPEGIVLMPFDTAVHADEVTTFAQGEQIDYAYRTGGGTDFSAAFDAAADEWMPGDKVLIFTDMECGIPEQPDFAADLLWVAVDARGYYSSEPPYGKYLAVASADM